MLFYNVLYSITYSKMLMIEVLMILILKTGFMETEPWVEVKY